MEGIFEVSEEDIIVATNTDFDSGINSLLEGTGHGEDFVELFPPELCNKLFCFLGDRDIFACCQCNVKWRHIINNNAQWRIRCIRRDWYKVGAQNDPFKWSDRPSHVGAEEFQFRPNPKFNLPPVASPRVRELCDWGKYFRQCLYLENNWKFGRYIVHKLSVPEFVAPTIFNACDCNGDIFAAATTLGYILLWSVKGRPRFLQSILAIRRRLEVEQLRLTEKVMVVICQTGLLQCYDISEYKEFEGRSFTLLFQLRIGGRFLDDNTYSFHLDPLSVEEVEDIYQLGDGLNEEDDHDVLVWARERFRDFPWLENDYLVCDLFFSIRNENIILSGVAAKSILFIDCGSGKVIKKLLLPPVNQICHKTTVRGNKLCLSVRRGQEHQPVNWLNFTFYLLVYDLNNVLLEEDPHYIEFQSQSIIEEVYSDVENKRVVWITRDSVIEAKDLSDRATLFVRHGLSYIDNLIVHNDMILYHQFDGFIVGIDWNGVQKYHIEMRLGIVRGLRCMGQFLVSGGDARNLFIWNVETGNLFHKVHHQPCRIEFVCVDETKIITLGREDPPVLVGYW